MRTHPAEPHLIPSSLVAVSRISASLETKGARGGVIPLVSNTPGGSRLSCGSLAESSAIDEFLSTVTSGLDELFEKDKQLDERN